jgi:hypothetical protein
MIYSRISIYGRSFLPEGNKLLRRVVDDWDGASPERF